jgi:hypothetical protein
MTISQLPDEMRVRVQLSFNKVQHSAAMARLAGLSKKAIASVLLEMIQRGASSLEVSGGQTSLLRVSTPQSGNGSEISARVTHPVASVANSSGSNLELKVTPAMFTFTPKKPGKL